jgi:hypothetical protein
MQLHMRYLRSLEDTEATRATCVKYLQNYLITFFPLCLNTIEQMHAMATELGGQLEKPRLPWKYCWIKNLLGWEWAKRAQLFAPRVKWAVKRRLDEVIHHLETSLQKKAWFHCEH